MLDPQALLAQVSHGEAREEWLVKCAKDHSRTTAIILGIFVTITWVPMLTVVTLILVSLGSIPSNPWPLLLHAPWLVLPALFLSAAFVFTAWRSEKTKGDRLLILLPEGIIEYEHWRNMRKRRIKLFEYANLEEVTLKVGRGGISFRLSPGSQLHIEDRKDLVFELVYREGRHEHWSLSNRYFSHSGEGLVQRIITDYTSYVQQSVSFQIRHEQAGSKPPK